MPCKDGYAPAGQRQLDPAQRHAHGGERGDIDRGGLLHLAAARTSVCRRRW